MSKRTIQLHPGAIVEAKGAREWYQERSPAAADAFVRELDHAIEQILVFPRRWPIYLLGTRRFLLQRFPYVVVYRESEESMEVVAIAHGRRKPGYWKARAEGPI